jgi:hypothetical protein
MYKKKNLRTVSVHHLFIFVDVWNMDQNINKTTPELDAFCQNTQEKTNRVT